MNCPNCEHPTSADQHYCSNCGQMQDDRTTSMKDFFHHFLGDYFTFDSKIFKSIQPLLFKPGFLTSEFIEGRRVRYITPLRLYIFISILFFLMLQWVAPEHDAGLDDGWDKYFGVYLPRLFFGLLPLFALFLWMLFSRKKWSFVINFVFSLHFHAFLFLSGSLYLILSEGFERFGLFQFNQFLVLVLAVWWLFYLLKAIKSVYQLTWLKAVFKFILLILLYSFVLLLSSILTLMLSSSI